MNISSIAGGLAAAYGSRQLLSAKDRGDRAKGMLDFINKGEVITRVGNHEITYHLG